MNLLKILIIILINLIFYWRTLFYGYTNDDLTVSQHEFPIPKNWFHRVWLEFYGIRYINSMESHGITLLLHIICSCLIYLVLGANNISLLAAILFSIHPANTRCSIWMSGKCYTSGAILALFFLGYPYFCPVIWALSIKFLSVNILLFPLVFLRTNLWPLALLPFFGLFFSKEILKRKFSPGWTKEGLLIRPRKLILFFKSYGYYFMLCFFPMRLGFHHQYLGSPGLNKEYNEYVYKIDKYFYLGLAVFLMVIYNFIWNYNPSSFGLWWFTVNIAIWCNIITIQQHIGEHYIYLANIGFCYWLANMIYPYPIISGVFIGAYAVRLWYFMPHYKNEDYSVDYALIEHRTYWRWWNIRGTRKWEMKDYTGALTDFVRARELCYYEPRVHWNLANVFLLNGFVNDCENCLQDMEKYLYETQEKPIWREKIVKLRRIRSEVIRTGQINTKNLGVVQ